MKALEEVVRYIHSRPGRPMVLVDGKRGDIDKTATAYAHACFVSVRGDSATVNPYMGFDTLEPYLKYEDKGIFALCKTSNPGSNDLQTLKVACTGEHLYEHVARLCVGPHCERWRQVGLVVGATDAEAMKLIREKFPSVWILAPGVGAQGGDLQAAIVNGINVKTKQGLIIAVSRQISKATDPKAEAEKIAKNTREILEWL